jgi:rod shape-determining protein MreD
VRRFLLPVLFAAFFILESIFLEVLPPKYFHHEHILVPHLLMIGIFFLTIYGHRNLGIIYGFIFGVLFDVVYTEVIGIYLCLYPLIAYLISKIMKILQNNLLIMTLVTLFGIALLELGAYEMNFLIHQTSMDFATFSRARLLPTILLNLVFIVILAYPLKRHFEKLAEQLRNE